MTTARRTTWPDGWPAGSVPADYVLGGMRAVLPGAVVDDARAVGAARAANAVPA